MAFTIMCLHYPLFFFFIIFLNALLCGATSDCLTEGAVISINATHNSNNTLISPGSKFELGFFAPDESFNKSNKYLGVWYYGSNPKIVVWVANRDKPLLDPNGYLVIKDGNAKVLGINGTSYWSTDHVSGANTQPLTATGKSDPVYHNGSLNFKLPPINFTDLNTTNQKTTSVIGMRLCLEDNGNLVLNDRKTGPAIKYLWQSFYSQMLTDTFLAGMNLDGSFNLTSWQSRDNPERGNYMLQLQLDNEDKKLVIKKSRGTQYYWESGFTPFDVVPQAVFDLLNPSFSGDYNNASLVMNFTGQIQFWRRGIGGGRGKLVWAEPKDRCSLYDVCGNFASCNSNNWLLCKCLPGFKPVSRHKWNSRVFSDGCDANSGIYSPAARNNEGMNDIFLRLPMMKVVKPSYNESTDVECPSECLKDSTCLAYSCGANDCTYSQATRCMKWAGQLNYLQEDYSQGITIFIRTTLSDIAMTSRGCKPCGANIIPYPLSTATDCGDPYYKNFQCNTSTGQVGFLTSSGTFRVTSIDPDSKSFSIQIGKTSNCDSIYIETHILSTNHSLPYKVRNCNARTDRSFFDADQVMFEQSFIEIDMEWEPPSEPACNATSDCRDWAHTTCKGDKGSTKRCFCGSKFRWDGGNLMCIREEVSFHLKVLLASIAGALALVLLCGVFSIRQIRKRSIAKDNALMS